MRDQLKFDIDEFACTLALLDSSKNCENILTEETSKNFWVYRSNYFVGHFDRLQSIFETIHKTTGEQNFKYLAREYLLQNPPTLENMDEFGNTFPSFLLNCPAIVNLPFLPYLAEIDWLRYSSSNRQIEIPSGSLALWEKIKSNQDCDGHLIVEDKKEIIQIRIINEEYVLVRTEEESL